MGCVSSVLGVVAANLQEFLFRSYAGSKLMRIWYFGIVPGVIRIRSDS